MGVIFLDFQVNLSNNELLDDAIEVCSQMNNLTDIQQDLSDMLHGEFRDCIEGRARTSVIHKTCRQERDNFEGNFTFYKTEFESEAGRYNQLDTQLDKCINEYTILESKILSGNFSSIKGAPGSGDDNQFFIYVGIAILAWFGRQWYERNKQPKPEDMRQYDKMM